VTYEELVTLLTDAIDQPNPTPPPEVIEGSAGEGDEIPAKSVLAQLVSAKAKLDNATAGVVSERKRQRTLDAEYAAVLTRYNDWRVSRFYELDRSTRTLEELVLAAAAVNPEYLNPTPPPTYREPALNAMDPGTPGDVNDIDAAIVRARTAVSFGRRLGVARSIVDGAHFSVDAVDQPPPQPNTRDALVRGTLLNTQWARLGSAQIAYAAALAETVAFVGYLENTP
jgi:hypothetical protein